MSFAIEISDLTKSYTLHKGQKSLLKLFSTDDGSYMKSKNRFSALNKINIRISKGEIVGITGMNGAGKSTLLKILSRITPPTAGKITIQGRMVSMLEVGTGFHPELTGRENVYLNGAILGLSRREIDAKFDSILAFAEVKTFIDVPVKRYSSGMYVRLAFAVAAHVDADIMLIDEVLAVGDISFQEKCIKKMDELNESGVTIVFVSHNTVQLERFVERLILIDNAEAVYDGSVAEGLTSYHQILAGRS